MAVTTPLRLPIIALGLLTLAACQQTTRSAALPSPASEPPTAPVQSVTPEHLSGLDETALGELLGQPTVIRREAAAEIWQYRTGACVLDLFLYAEPPEADGRVTHLEARNSRDASPADARACLASLSDPAGRLTASAD